MADITQLVFKNGAWLILGFVLYYALSFAKVLLLVRVQSRFLVTAPASRLDIKYLLSLYLNSIFHDFLLHRMTLSYLTSNNKEQWKLLENKAINFYHNFLEAITSMLKPFLIIGVIWMVLKSVVDRKLAYNELQISLSEIQLMISYIKSNEYYAIVDDNKEWAFVCIFILCALLGVLKKYEERINNVKSIISTCFTVVSIIGSVTFFGTKLQSHLTTTSKNLAALKLEIEDMHDNVYREVGKIITYQELKEAVSQDVINAEVESKRLDSLAHTVSALITRPEIAARLSQVIENAIIQYKTDNTISMPASTIGDSNYQEDYRFTKYIERHLHQQKTKSDAYQKTYWDDKRNWTKGEGIKYEKLAAEFRERVHLAPSKMSVEADLAIRNIASIIVEKTIGAVGEAVGFKNQELPKAIASFLSVENFNEHLAPKIMAALEQFKNGVIQPTTKKTAVLFKNRGNSGERIRKTRQIHNTLYKGELAKAKREVIIAEAAEIVEDRVPQKIEDIIQGFEIPGDYNRFTSQVIADYKKEINLPKINEIEYKRLVSSSPIPDMLLRRVLRGPSSRVHPFPANACPICAYMLAANIP